jgi:alcohol dehydrogenase class IV
LVLTPPFHCPTKIFRESDYANVVAELHSSGSWILITTKGWLNRSAHKQLIENCGTPECILETTINPVMNDVISMGEKLSEVDYIIALGGGSTIDAAKGATVYHALKGNEELFEEHLKSGTQLPIEMPLIPITAIPTTSGSGSEITRWGTIWGDDKIKYSVTHNNLYPRYAILDPKLCSSMPEEIALSSGLDALSHAMESVWNIKHTELTDLLSMSAISLIKENLPIITKNGNNLEARNNMQTAALIASMSMSTTQTALAHSISYPFTAHHDMPHGFACSFTLPSIAKFNMVHNEDRLKPITAAFGSTPETLAADINSWFLELGLNKYVSKYINKDIVNNLSESLINRSRAANNIRDIDVQQANTIVIESLENLGIE